MHPTRDFTFVSDTIEGFIRIAEKQKSIGEVINIGSNFEISIKDLTEKILTLSHSDAKIEVDKKRVRPKSSEVERLCADCAKARKLLNWKPCVKLDEGLKRTIKWISENIARYKVDTYMI
jgi:nucleoside-diphosphate-sugar epimerase